MRGAILAVAVIGLAAAAPASAKLGVTWMKGYAAPGTPAKYNKVGSDQGRARASARNVLVLGARDLGRRRLLRAAGEAWIVSSRAPGWQVWSVERRGENLLEDRSELQPGQSSTGLGRRCLTTTWVIWPIPSITQHIHPVPDSAVPFARQWGLKVAVEDLHDVIRPPASSAGAWSSAATRWAAPWSPAPAPTWASAARPADKRSGLVYDDGGSSSQVISAPAAQALAALATSTPWLAFSGVPAPALGPFSAVGSTAALVAPNVLSSSQSFSLTPSVLRPPLPARQPGHVRFRHRRQDVQALVFAAQAHVGQLNTSVSPAGWSSAGAITPINRWAAMLAGAGMSNVDGGEWYFPQRLTDDTGAVDQGNASPAQKGAGGGRHDGAQAPAVAAHLRLRRLRRHPHHQGRRRAGQAEPDPAQPGAAGPANRHGSYAHNDPAAAFPHNVFFSNLMTFLAKVAKR